MKKYIPIDFDEKGKAILGRERNTPTSNGFIPTTWAPGGGGGDEGKNGIKSISISPAITTTPALDSLFPIYWDDLTEEQKEEGLEFFLYTDAKLVDTDTYTITVTPTAEWYAFRTDPGTTGGKGEPFTFEQNPSHGSLGVSCGVVSEHDTEEASILQIDIGIGNGN